MINLSKLLILLALVVGLFLSGNSIDAAITKGTTLFAKQIAPGPSDGDVCTTDGTKMAWTDPETISGKPAGSDTYLQYNDNGSFGAEAALVYNDATNLLTLTNGKLIISTTAGNNFLELLDSLGFNAIEFKTDSNGEGEIEIFQTDGSSQTLTHHLSAGDGVVLNENGIDLDFRVESDNQTNMLGVDAGTDGIALNGVIYGFPVADGSNGEFLSTNGSAGLSWRPIGTVIEFSSDATLTVDTFSNLGDGIATSTTIGWIAIRDCSIIGMSTQIGLALSLDGVWDVEVYANGSEVWSDQLAYNGDTSIAYQTQNPGVDSVSEGQVISVNFNEIAGGEPFTEPHVLIEIIYD